MDKMLFIAMNGARQSMQAQTNISHNLANANTVGFKSHFNTFANWHVEGPGFNTRVYNQQIGKEVNLQSGSFITTKRDLDVAVQGDGWIAVQDNNGKEAYTKAGDLRLDQNGFLTTGTGYSVIGNSGPIVIPPAQKIEIGADGSISVIPVGQSADSMAITDRIKLVRLDADDIEKNADGLMQSKTGEPAQLAADVTLASGVIETSNVNPVAELIELIQNARQFEANVKLMKTAQENDEVSSRLLRNS
ncbi:MAG: flagellar basal body rod protein FlgF [Gammaproteobacteria bacterium]|nr:flagellar basal body rod protein FlgF [Gammaproteobacteria bacterium]